MTIVGSLEQVGEVHKITTTRKLATPHSRTPTREAQTMGRLPGGEMVRFGRERGDYVYVRAGNDAAGWVERGQFGRISEH